jgi:starch phosphorylase
MEIALEEVMPTYAGGLGVLAGDTLRAAADLELPMAAVTLLHRKGYFRQHLDEEGRQTETASTWSPKGTLERLPTRVSVNVEGRSVCVQAWRYLLRGVNGHAIPVYLLDTALRENDPWDRKLSDELYGGEHRYRLCQEVVLGIGGIAMLSALGHTDVGVFHMNEGHSSLLTLALLEEQVRGNPRKSASDSDAEAVRRRCVFTTHTPVSAGHDKFTLGLAEEVLGAERAGMLARLILAGDRTVNLTSLAMFLSRSINAVSQRHGKVSRVMFPDRRIGAVTNGVHAGTWVSPPFTRLYYRHLPNWQRDNDRLRDAASIPLEEISPAHDEA